MSKFIKVGGSVAALLVILTAAGFLGYMLKTDGFSRWFAAPEPEDVPLVFAEAPRRHGYAENPLSAEEAALLTRSLEGSVEVFIPPEPDPNIPYQSLYPGLYTPREKETLQYTGTIFLTFDDGPSANTERILEILRNQGIKATFFVVTGEPISDWKAELLRKIVEEGHTLGVHSTTHDFHVIYNSVEDYLNDFATASDQIYEATGIRPWVFRFPGGTRNSYNQSTYVEIVNEMNRRGFVHYDWNVSAQDASNTATSADIWWNLNNGLSLQKQNVVLLHDTKVLTVDLLDKYITTMKEKGYVFSELTPTVQPLSWFDGEIPE